MSTFRNPFLKKPSVPGRGEVHVRLLAPAKPVYSTLSYTYPLKLIPSTPHTLENTDKPGIEPTSVRPESVPLLFLLSYGGGLLPPDTIELDIQLDPGARLTIATQGSTKIFPSRPWQAARAAEGGGLGGGGVVVGGEARGGGNSRVGPDSSTWSLPGEGRPPAASVPLKDLPTAKQTLRVHLGAGSALCLTPDPTQPFADSKYMQHQAFTMHASASLLLLDWTTEGRRARGESWDAHLWRGCNEVWREMQPSPKKQATEDHHPDANTTGAASPGATEPDLPTKILQLRDQVILESDAPGAGPDGGISGYGLRSLKEEEAGCFGTLVAVGELVRPVGDFFIEEFEALPRVGGRKWDDDDDNGDKDDGGRKESNKPGVDGSDTEAERRRQREAWRQRRLKLEKQENVLWNAARVRGLVMVKFTAKDAQGARHWLNQMLVFEGTVAREFGLGGLMSVR